MDNASNNMFVSIKIIATCSATSDWAHLEDTPKIWQIQYTRPAFDSRKRECDRGYGIYTSNFKKNSIQKGGFSSFPSIPMPALFVKCLNNSCDQEFLDFLALTGRTAYYVKTIG